MNRSTTLLFAAFALLAAVFSQAAEIVKPNIVFILADDLGPGDLGCYGGDPQLTPHIDQLAREGTRFTQYYSASPICSPSRAGLITGMFPARWNITSFLQTRKGNRACEQADFLAAAAPSLPRQLKNAGYVTAHFGKWHLGGGRDVTDAPRLEEYGYDEHASTWESPQPHPDITATNWIWSPQDKVKRWDRTAFFVDQTLDFLRRHADRPAMINLWLDDVHTPWVPHENSAKGDSPANYQAVLQECDRQLGRLFAGLKDLGVEDKTLVIFASDNGALPTFGGARSAGLRGSKLSLYEGGIRMPLIVRWTSHVPAGRVDEATELTAVDMFPTLCAFAGAKPPQPSHLDGEDVSTTLLGNPQKRNRPLYWEYGRNEQSFRYPQGRDRSPNLAMRDGAWKLLVNADGTSAELYDLDHDRAESENVADKHPEVTERLTRQLLAWRKSLPAL